MSGLYENREGRIFHGMGNMVKARYKVADWFTVNFKIRNWINKIYATLTSEVMNIDDVNEKTA